jgi:hypothetical protein
MAKRNSSNDIKDLDDLTHIDEIVIDKRNEKRSAAKKNRRNRHYEKAFIKLALNQKPKGSDKAVSSDEDE